MLQEFIRKISNIDERREPFNRIRGTNEVFYATGDGWRIKSGWLLGRVCVGAEINLQLIAAEAPPGTYEREETCIFPRDAGGVSIKFENYAATLNACVRVCVCV